MPNDAELVTALERAKAQLLQRKQKAGEVEGSAINHNISCANLIIGHFSRHKSLAKVQRELAEKVIERANKKERIHQ